MGDTHEETDILTIGDQEECGRQVNCCYRQLKTRQALIGKELDSGDSLILIDEGGKTRRLWTGLRMVDLRLTSTKWRGTYTTEVCAWTKSMEHNGMS